MWASCVTHYETDKTSNAQPTQRSRLDTMEDRTISEENNIKEKLSERDRRPLARVVSATTEMSVRRWGVEGAAVRVVLNQSFACWLWLCVAFERRARRMP